MNQSLLDQLSRVGASSELFVAGEAAVLTDEVQIIDRSDLAIVRFTGSDAAEFLQAQTCNDLKQVSVSAAQLNGYCSPKGRLLALPMVVQDPDSQAIYWLLPRVITDGVVKRLTMLASLPLKMPASAPSAGGAMLRSDVSIELLDDWVVMGLAASDARLAAALNPWLGQSDTAEMASWGTMGHVVCKTRSAEGTVRTLMFGPADKVGASLLACLAALADESESRPQWTSQATWVLGDVKAGVPCIVAETQDAFVPQMVNMEQVGGLSFTKGCYPGQEIVARMQYLGKLKRVMMRFSAKVDEPGLLAPAAGDSLICGDDVAAGQVVASAVVGDTIEVLAVVKTSADHNAFHFNDHALSMQPLPYAMPGHD